MAFAKKTWKDRIAEFPTRRRLTKEDNTSELVTVAREEGTLSQEGDAFSAENMNDLENRIDAEFTEVNGNFEWKSLFTNISDSNAHSLPDGWSELLIIMQNADGYNASTNVNRLYVSGSVKTYKLSGYGSFNVSASSITNNSGNDMTGYYR